MKTLRNIACVLSSLIAFTFFASCSNGSSSDDASADNPTRIANYVGMDYSDENSNRSISCDFYDDGSWVATVCGASFTPLYTGAKGTYTGDPSTDGAVTLTFAECANSEHTLKELTPKKTETVTVASGKTLYDGYTYYRQLLPKK